MRFGTREYTAQVLAPVGLNKWQVVKNTTFTVTDYLPQTLFDADAFKLRQDLRIQMMYGAAVKPPRFPWWGSGA